MADLVIEITPDVLRDKSRELSSSAGAIEKLLNEISTEVKGLAASWIGDASSTYINKFNGLNDDFSKIVSDIRDYSTFLSKAAEDYSQTQTQVQNLEETLKS